VKAGLLSVPPRDTLANQPLQFRRTKTSIEIVSKAEIYNEATRNKVVEAEERYIPLTFRVTNVEQRRGPPMPPIEIPKDDPG
jgi:hypothetical protein